MDDDGVVVTAVGGKLNPDPPDPPVVIEGGENKVKHYTLGIDFDEAVKSTEGADTLYTFDYNIRAALMESDEVNFRNLHWNDLIMHGGLVVVYKTTDDKFYMFIAGTSTHGLTNAPDEPNVIRWVADTKSN